MSGVSTAQSERHMSSALKGVKRQSVIFNCSFIETIL